MRNTNTNLLILAAGASSRMKKQLANINELTTEEVQQSNTRSKSLISLDDEGRPLLDYLLFNAKKAGYNTVYIIVSKDNSMFKSFYGVNQSNNDYKGLTIHFVVQHIPIDRIKPLGTADAVFQALKQYPELKSTSFTVCNGDNLYSKKALELLRAWKKSPNALLGYNRGTLQYTEERILKFALIYINKDSYLKDIIEKPKLSDLEKFKDIKGKLRVSMNIFKFNGNMFYNYLKNCPVHKERNEKELPTALLNMIKEFPNSTFGIPISEHVPDLTSKEDIAIMKAYVRDINLSSW